LDRSRAGRRKALAVEQRSPSRSVPWGFISPLCTAPFWSEFSGILDRQQSIYHWI
jgi:hypothetical protein